MRYRRSSFVQAVSVGHGSRYRGGTSEERRPSIYRLHNYLPLRTTLTKWGAARDGQQCWTSAKSSRYIEMKGMLHARLHSSFLNTASDSTRRTTSSLKHQNGHTALSHIERTVVAFLETNSFHSAPIRKRGSETRFVSCAAVLSFCIP